MMNASRREFLGFMRNTAKVAAGIYLTSILPRQAYGSQNPNFTIDDMITKEANKWSDINIVEYLGQITHCECRQWLVKKAGLETAPKEELEQMLKICDNETKLHFFTAVEWTYAVRQMIEPTAKEYADYLDFIGEMGGIASKIGYSANSHTKKTVYLLRKVYHAFQEKIGGTTAGDPTRGWGITSNSIIISPAVLLSGREKGCCTDKAFALSDIYNRSGIKSRICEGSSSDDSGKFWHAWVRAYINNTFVDLDPTWYDNFKMLRRIESEKSGVLKK